MKQGGSKAAAKDNESSNQNQLTEYQDDQQTGEAASQQEDFVNSQSDKNESYTQSNNKYLHPNTQKNAKGINSSKRSGDHDENNPDDQQSIDNGFGSEQLSQINSCGQKEKALEEKNPAGGGL